MRAILCAALLASPALAEPIPGSDDPAFRAPFDRALQGDDPTALRDLHAAAEAGNTAALLALPFASAWLRDTLPFAERKTLARVNTIPMAEAASAADPVAALWAWGEIGTDSDAVLSRAFGLYAAGEPGKASSLALVWVNQTGGYGALPADFFDRPIPAWITHFVLLGRLTHPFDTTTEAVDALLVERLKAKDPAAWLALAAFAGLHLDDAIPSETDRIATLVASAGISQDEASRRMQAAVPVLKALRGEPLDPDAAAAATAQFRNEPEFQPLLSLCASACPKTQEACTRAFVAGFGHPQNWVVHWQPLTSLISTEDFFATPRGRLALLRTTSGKVGKDPEASPALAAARQMDACLADAILAALP